MRPESSMSSSWARRAGSPPLEIRPGHATPDAAGRIERIPDISVHVGPGGREDPRGGRAPGCLPPAQVLVEEAQVRLLRGAPVLLLLEAVALVVEDDVLDGHAVLLHRRDDLVGLD